jgi:hypothetical protein
MITSSRPASVTMVYLKTTKIPNGNYVEHRDFISKVNLGDMMFKKKVTFE